MRTKQRRTMTLEVSPEQRATLENTLAALPSEPVDEPVQGGGKLAGLFYHPNTACRVMALVLSAGYDAVSGRSPGAANKVERAIQVFTLVSDDAEGRGLLEGLKTSLASDAGDFLSAIHGKVAPYLRKKMDVVVLPVEAKPAAPMMPHAVEDGEAMPRERLTVQPAPRARPAPPARPPACPVDDVDEVADESDGADERHADAAPPRSVGPTAAEAAAAAAAALAAMEAPYEEVIEDASPPRFDPDRDLEPDERGGRRRRRPRGLEGLERPRPDQVPVAPTPVAEGEPDKEAPAAARDAAPPAPPATAPDAITVSRDGDAVELAEFGLEVLRLALQRAREAGLSGRLKIEVVIAGSDEAQGGERRRRSRRRRRRGPND